MKMKELDNLCKSLISLANTHLLNSDCKQYTVFVDMPDGKRGALTILLTDTGKETGYNPYEYKPTRTVVTEEELAMLLQATKRWNNEEIGESGDNN